jgi:glucose/arabinose dehydrogenase
VFADAELAGAVGHDENGKPTGVYGDFLTGFVADDASVWGRPVDVAEDVPGDLSGR